MHTWLVRTATLCEPVTASTAPEAFHNGPRSYAQCVVLPRRHVTNDHRDRNGHALRYARFLQIQHVAHYMKAEMKDSYSQNKATRSLRERGKKKKKKKTKEWNDQDRFSRLVSRDCYISGRKRTCARPSLIGQLASVDVKQH